MDEKLRAAVLAAQLNEITEYHIYRALAAVQRDPRNREVLERIADEEHGHYEVLKAQTDQEVAPSRWRVFKYVLIARILGVTFGLKLMERGEDGSWLC